MKNIGLFAGAVCFATAAFSSVLALAMPLGSVMFFLLAVAVIAGIIGAYTLTVWWRGTDD